MGKSKKSATALQASQAGTVASKAAGKASSHAVRETVESIIIAFVLAFLFRTFEAEAFVIPTGSMAPTLMGRHKDVDCPKCGYRYQVSASEEDSDNVRRMRADTIAGMCPMCNYVMPMRPNLPQTAHSQRSSAPYQSSYNGDRILVNKYLYTFADPERWDVVVFKFPGDAQINYIKRLVGLPNETLRIFQGDLFVRRPDSDLEEDFAILSKPPEKVLAMRQLVHDTNHDPADLDAAGWPLRWQTDGWQVDKSIEKNKVRQRYHVDPTGNDVAWLRYEHFVPTYGAWQLVDAIVGQQVRDTEAAIADLKRFQQPRLITDANPYNAREDSVRIAGRPNLEISADRQGLHWVGDLIVEADLEIEASQGELLLDLVEAGRHFTCTIDLSTGETVLSAEGASAFGPQAKTSLHRVGKHRVTFANVDDQLLLWIDGKLVEFDAPTIYDVDQVFGGRREILPRTSEDDPGDLSPAGIGARDAKLTVSRLRVWRDIYYIADDWQRQRMGTTISDYNVPSDVFDLMTNPDRWGEFATRQPIDFPLRDDQFFVLGDNSAESADARLWYGDSGRGGRPGGDYLERRLLIGKALCVYWPHSWNRIPGTPIPFPLFPNFADMRLVR